MLLPGDKAPQNHTDPAPGPLRLLLPPLQPLSPAEWPVTGRQRPREQPLAARSQQEGGAAGQSGRSGAARSDTGCAGVRAEAVPGTGTSATGKVLLASGNRTATGRGRTFWK